jgi:hypothetical protein
VEDLSPDAKATVDALREVETPSAASLADGLSRLEAQVGPGLSAPLGEGAGGLTPLAKLLVGGLAVGALVAGYLLVTVPNTSPPAPTTVAAPATTPTPEPTSPPPQPPESEAEVAPEPAQPALEEELPATPDAPKVVPKKPRTDEGSNLEEELRLVRGAGKASNGGDHRAALELLDEHKRRFPRGVLAGERELTRAKTTCAMGNAERAAKIAKRFLKRHPKSHLRSRFESVCK